MTETQTDEKEALRLKLAKQASQSEKLQADVKAFSLKLKERDAAEARRQALYAEETKRLAHDHAVLRNKAGAAGKALADLRRLFVPLEVRDAVKATEREVRAAQKRLADAQSQLRGERQALEDLKHRVKTVPSAAAPKDLLAELDRMAKAMAPSEAREAQAQEALEAANRAHQSAQADYDVAMRAAQAL